MIARGAIVALKQEGMELEQHLHRLFRLITQILGCQALILPIDDIDMVPERGYDVLEVLRKYLVSPYVIPIVSGQYEVYHHLVENYFSKGYPSKNSSDGDSRAKDLLMPTSENCSPALIESSCRISM